MGRKKLYTPDTFENAVNKYFDECFQDGNIFPDEAGMILYLNISLSTYENYKKDIEFADIIARARMRRESWLTRRMASEPKLAQGCMNNLMQAKNGGFTNRPDNQSQAVQITVQIAGCDNFNPGA